MNNENGKNIYKDMLLVSDDGFCMPFELKDDEGLDIMLDYGKQKHPSTGVEFQHDGIDLICKDKDLYALADGLIIGAGSEEVHGNYIVAKYGKYEVTYGHLSEAYTPYGTKVTPGQVIAKSGDFLHLGVHFNGRSINPMEFLTIIWQNIQQLAAMGIKSMSSDGIPGTENVKTKYDKDLDEIMMMMMRWLPSYLNELKDGHYRPSGRIETMLRETFSKAADKEYFYESMPSIANPLGMTARALPLIEKIQNIIIGDFLNFMALRHGRYLSTWTDDEKKNFLISQEDRKTA